MNLFFIHTPMQILVAQNLIIKKNLKNNFLILSYTGNSAMHFYTIFDKMIIDRLWINKYKIGNLDNGVFSFKRPFKLYIKLLIFSFRIKKIILHDNIESIYFGDINHPAYVFLGEKWSNTRNIFFFEEGLSNYSISILKKKINYSKLNYIKKWITDNLIYLPLGVKGFSKYTQSLIDCDFEFKITKKYNILPLIINKYDEITEFDIYLSDLMIIELEKIKSKLTYIETNILYLSSSATYLFSNPIDDELEVLENILKKINKKFRLLVKFHPKDLNHKKTAIKNYFEINNINYLEIFCGESFPVEVLFNKIKIDFLFGYGSSSQLYFEVFCPNIPNYNLFHALKELYVNKKINNNYPATSWKIWQDLYLTIFNKKPFEF